ncbi:hypothetical protein EV401DRAFT_2014824, partial [Pisolithus croceorrhizus]
MWLWGEWRIALPALFLKLGLGRLSDFKNHIPRSNTRRLRQRRVIAIGTLVPKVPGYRSLRQTIAYLFTIRVTLDRRLFR